MLRNLLIVNQARQHTVSGSGYLSQNNDAIFDFYSKFTGNFNDIKSLQGSSYVKVKNLSLNKWRQMLKFYGYQIKNSFLNGQFWFNWQYGQLKSVQLLVNAKSLSFITSDNTHAVYKLSKISGNFLWQPIQHGWKLLADHFNLKVNGVKEPENEFSLTIKHNANTYTQRFWAHYFYLRNLQLLFAHNVILPKNVRDCLQNVNPTGKLSKVTFVHHGNFAQLNNYKFSAQLDHITTHCWQKILGVKNFSGKIKLQPGYGDLNVAAKNTYVDFGNLFSKPILLRNLLGNVQWLQTQDKKWFIKSDNLSLINQDLSAHGQVSLLLPHNNYNNSMISLLAEFDLSDSAAAKNYLPKGALSSKLAKWLNKAFVQGNGVAGKVILHGKLKDFPFDSRQGTFIVDSQVRNTTLHYADNWPDVKNIDAHLKFIGRSMSCDLAKGQVFDSQIKTAHAAIVGMGKKPAVLQLNTSVTSNANDILRYLNNSDLHKTFTGILQPLSANGMADLHVNMLLPIEKPSAVKLSGNAILHQNNLAISSWNLGLDKLNGKLLFTENKLWSKNLRATLFNHPAKIAVQFSHIANKNRQSKIDIKSYLDVASLENYFNWPKLSFIHGGANYTAEFSLQTNSVKQANYLVHISSDLQGVSVDMPAPLSKTKQQIDPFSMKMWFGHAVQAKALLNLDDNLSAALRLRFKDHHPYFYNANIHFGAGQTKWQQQKGLYIDGSLATFDWKAWRKFLHEQSVVNFANNQTQFTNTIKNVLREINVKISSIKFFGKKLVNTVFKIKPQQNTWSFGISNNIIDGDILFPYNYPKSILQINLNKLILTPGEFASNKSKLLNPANIPAVDIKINNFVYGQQNLGKVDVGLRSTKNIAYIKYLNISSPAYVVTAQGYWKKRQNGKYASVLRGDIESNNVMPLLNALKIHSGLIAQKGDAQFNLNWPGIIYQPNLKYADGDVYVHFGKGQIIGIDEKANESMNLGRLLTLLSINRLLTMSFADLFQSGYSFNKMKGQLSLHNGKMDIKSLNFDGSTASIDILGDVNMLTHYLDLRLAVTPYITSSVPIIAGLIGGPIVGITAFLANKVFGKLVDQISTYNYTVTGDWQHPKIVRLL
jgi:uncharacterized protein (TIGR02099 family)